MSAIIPASAASAVGFGGWVVAATEQVVSKGPDLVGIAAIMAAATGMISAIGALVLGWRSRSAPKADDGKDEVIMGLVEQLIEKGKREHEEEDQS